MRVLFSPIEELKQSFQDKVDFKLIYIMEAHSQDIWPIRSSRANPTGAPVLYNLPTDLESRLKIVTDFQQAFNPSMEIFVDFSDKFEELYAPWPMRWFVFLDGVLKFIEGGLLDLDGLRSEIQALLN